MYGRAYMLYVGTNFLQLSVVAAMSHSARATAQAAAAGRALGAVRALCGFSRLARFAWQRVRRT